MSSNLNYSPYQCKPYNHHFLIYLAFLSFKNKMWCVCVWALMSLFCISVYEYIHVLVCLYVCLSACIYVFLCMSMCAYMFVCLCVWVGVYTVHLLVCIYVFAHCGTYGGVFVCCFPPNIWDKISHWTSSSSYWQDWLKGLKKCSTSVGVTSMPSF